jgi:integrase
MARQIKGRIFKRGKSNYYYLQFYLNGKQIVQALKDENGNSITSKTSARKAADIVLAPYMAKDSIQRRKQAVDALKTAKEKAADLERQNHVIKLVDAFDLSLKKPKSRQASKKVIAYKKTYWNDFVAFLNHRFPDIVVLNDVLTSHAEEYVEHLINYGKFITDISLKNNKKSSVYKKKNNSLSPRTINGYITAIKEVFKLLKRDSELEENPFDIISKLKKKAEPREAFTLKELEKISQTADDFTRALFIVGLCTGLRQGDICTLRWIDIDFKDNIITKATGKTGKEVIIPILPPLLEFLQEQKESSEAGEYVLPIHAKMQRDNPSGITYRVKNMLESNGITTTRKSATGRNISIKGVHSLRHSFCYYCGLYNVPLAVVQAAVGHITPEMTRHYSMHATKSDMKEAFKKLPYMFGVQHQPRILDISADEIAREKLIELARNLPIEKVNQILQQLSVEYCSH